MSGCELSVYIELTCTSLRPSNTRAIGFTTYEKRGDTAAIGGGEHREGKPRVFGNQQHFCAAKITEGLRVPTLKTVPCTMMEANERS